MKYLHLSKELEVRLDFRGKPVFIVSPMKGETYVRPSPKPMSRRDQHRMNVGTNQRNAWPE